MWLIVIVVSLGHLLGKGLQIITYSIVTHRQPVIPPFVTIPKAFIINCIRAGIFVFFVSLGHWCMQE